MKVFIAADHGGFELKSQLVAQLKSEFDVEDLGANEHDPKDDYPQFAFAVAEQVAIEPGSMGVLLCRSGIGMSIAANKVKGVYAALCHTKAQAAKAREHNNANVIVLDADFEHEDPQSVVKTFLSTQFAGERHTRRVDQIKSYEQSHL